MRFALARGLRDLLMHRVFYSMALAGVALGLFAGVSVWLLFASRGVGELGRVRTKDHEPAEQHLQLTLTQLVARQVSSATSRAEVRAATAQLLEGWEGFHVQQVEVYFTGAAGESAEGFLSRATGPVFFRADEGWVDSSEGNLLLAGNIHGRSEGDGLELWARRLEYEPAADEVRLSEVRLRRAGLEKTDSFLVTDSRLKHLRFGASGVRRNEHPFFRLYGGGKVND